MTAFIYTVTNQITGKKYVGQTIRPVQTRWRSHVCASVRGSSECRVFHAAIRKYGAVAFVVESVRLDGVSQDDVDDVERETIIRASSLVPNGYNLDAGGRAGRKSHIDTRERLGTSLSGRTFTALHKSRIAAALKGIQRSAAHKAKCSAWQIGRKLPERTLVKLRAAHRGQPSPNKGKSPSSETRRKLSAALKGRVKSEETRAKLRACAIARAAKKRQERAA